MLEDMRFNFSNPRMPLLETSQGIRGEALREANFIWSIVFFTEFIYYMLSPKKVHSDFRFQIYSASR